LPTRLDKQPRLAELIPRLRRYARALVGDAAAADDLVQGTLARARAKLDLYREGTDLRAGLFTVMHDIYANNMRATHASEPTEEEDSDAAVCVPQGDPLGVRDLERAMARLTLEQRSVLLLVTLEDMSYDDVARTLGIPASTVISRLSGARGKLRSLLLGDAKLKIVK
jgi:RNA polymerase sigma-70 factor, ECF subfamily